MTRGNQREKAREKNLKAQSGQVRLPTMSKLELIFSNFTPAI
ncbi:hypothetical protein TWF569_005067 [Orbilia oligospora]|uniref:Small EDRK-rich factor-like N-terminal domain-containing protein n=1 Tax=Orbilia oligospora TaxID=2813651 RepID=A0A7C8J4F7_ORBOL|nr:hypothetical protein TWF103_003307 [Orbilia oligospora]KAF3084780.1 hypothetical protein TWF706_000684 [Orbilia oligospora]KAF3093648.1 hypothetical protein TWF102_007865 [Orbilia oligospora]KAF3149446.1 hypothetical protein TWF569_005067 [Orbilia oligospora]